MTVLVVFMQFSVGKLVTVFKVVAEFQLLQINNVFNIYQFLYFIEQKNNDSYLQSSGGSSYQNLVYLFQSGLKLLLLPALAIRGACLAQLMSM